MISLKEANSLIQTPADLWEACVRNDIYVPALKSRICSKRFLLDVRNKEVFLPLIGQIRKAGCPRPPTVAVI